MTTKRYVANPDTWFDAGTEAVLVAWVTNDSAVFVGTKNGHPDEELCSLDEFDLVETEWPTNCHEVDGWDTSKCCTSCHAEAEEIGREPVEMFYQGRQLFVCCTCAEYVSSLGGKNTPPEGF